MLRVRRPLLALVTLLLLLAGGYTASALSSGSDSGTPASSPRSSASSAAIRVVPISSLPEQVAQTIALVRANGPFPYSRDGAVFHNREHRLPEQRDGYYHEYTVPTPGESGRGARRLVAGAPGEFYYSADHYESFVRVDPDR